MIMAWYFEKYHIILFEVYKNISHCTFYNPNTTLLLSLSILFGKQNDNNTKQSRHFIRLNYNACSKKTIFNSLGRIIMKYFGRKVLAKFQSKLSCNCIQVFLRKEKWKEFNFQKLHNNQKFCWFDRNSRVIIVSIDSFEHWTYKLLV